jgi:hypothetical protein
MAVKHMPHMVIDHVVQNDLASVEFLLSFSLLSKSCFRLSVLPTGNGKN